MDKPIKEQLKEISRFFDSAYNYFFKEREENESSESLSLNCSESRSNTCSYNLREQMIDQVVHLKEIFYNDEELDVLKLNKTEKEEYEEFLRTYSNCPLCGGKNHRKDLSKYFFERRSEELLFNLRNKPSHKINLSVGILCCTCFKKFFSYNNQNYSLLY